MVIVKIRGDYDDKSRRNKRLNTILKKSGDYNIVLIRAIGEVIISNQAKDLITTGKRTSCTK